MEQPIYLTPTLGDRMRDAYWAKPAYYHWQATCLLIVVVGVIVNAL
jgi:hypothetical protein